MIKLIGFDGKGIGTNCEKSAFTPVDIPLLKTAGELKESGAWSDDAIPPVVWTGLSKIIALLVLSYCITGIGVTIPSNGFPSDILDYTITYYFFYGQFGLS